MFQDDALLAGRGEVRTHLRAVDWSTFEEGAPASWPISLRTAVGLMLDSSVAMYVVWGSRLHFIYNDAYIEIGGNRHPDALLRPLWEIWPHARAGIEPIFDKVLRGEPQYMKDMEFQLTRDGQPESRWSTFSATPIRNPDNTISGILVIEVGTTPQVLAESEKLRRLTEQHLAEVALNQSNLQLQEKIRQLNDADIRKDEFLVMLAHELRNPLAPISAASDLLEFSNLSLDRIRQASQIVSQQARQMTSLIDDLTDVSRVTRGLVTLNKVIVDARLVASDAVEQVRPLIDARGHHLEIHIPSESNFVLGDKERLVQVVANVLNNAAKYTPEGGNIVLKLESGDGTVVINVIDNGIGMTQKLIDRAFDLFAQADRSADRAEGGLGLGLALVRSLIELHQGTVSARSDGLGTGSEFSIVLPRALQQDMPAATAQADVMSLAVKG